MLAPWNGEGNGTPLQYSCLKIPWTEDPGSCSPWGRYESDTTERLHFHFSLSHIGEGNGNPLQCSCLEYPGDGGAWWAAVYGVEQSRTRLKRLSSSLAAPWKKSYDQPRQPIKKQRHYFANKNPYDQRYGFSSSQVRM